MSVYIKGMEMPTEGEYYMTLYVCSDGSAYIDVASFQVDKDRFEAVPVPDHGDLIDRVAFREEMDKHYPFDRYTQSKHEWEDAAKSAVIKMLVTAPTIIPASTADKEEHP